MLVLFECTIVYSNTTILLNIWLIIQMHLCVYWLHTWLFSHIHKSFISMQHTLWTIAFMQHTLWTIAFMQHTLWTIVFMQHTLWTIAFMLHTLWTYCLYAKHFTNHCCHTNTSIEWQLLLCKHFYGPHWNLCFIYTITRISLSPWIPLCPNSWTVNSCWEARML